MYADICYLGKAFFGKATGFRKYFFKISGTYRTACIRDDAVGTELVASFLNFDICTRAVGLFAYGLVFKGMCVHYVADTAENIFI